MTTWPRTCLAISVALGVAGCSIFGDKEEESTPPAPLLQFDSSLKVKKRWSTDVGGSTKALRVGLSPVSDAIRVYAAGGKGQVQALELTSGDRIWQTNLNVALTAGPGVGDDRVVVATADGEVVVLEASTGAELWRRQIDAEVLATPAIGGERVIVRTADGRLLGLNGESGDEEWLIEEEVPRLSLRGTSTPAIVADQVICGFDNGRLMAVNLLEGDVEWEQIITAPSGRSDLERLVDIDGAIAAAGQDIYATGFQGQVVAIAMESGQLLWAREISSYQGPGLDWTQAYVAASNDDLVALSRTTGVEQWRTNVLANRQLTAPVSFGEAVVVGDFEGYLHWFAATDGAPLARVRTGKQPVSGALHTQGDLLLAQTDGGSLSAYEIIRSDDP